MGVTDAPIGLWMIDSEEGKPFSGVYDGKGYSIQQAQNRVFYKEYAKGTAWSSTFFNCCFGTIQSSGKNIEGYSDTGGLIGAVYGGSKNSEISNCYNVGDITGAYPNVGGLFGVAWNTSGGRVTIRNCYNVGKVTSPDPSLGGPLHGIARILNYYNSYHIVADLS